MKNGCTTFDMIQSSAREVNNYPEHKKPEICETSIENKSMSNCLSINGDCFNLENLNFHGREPNHYKNGDKVIDSLVIKNKIIAKRIFKRKNFCKIPVGAVTSKDHSKSKCNSRKSNSVDRIDKIDLSSNSPCKTDQMRELQNEGQGKD